MHFEDKSDKVSAQLSIVVAKIARFDWPIDWPELFPTLLAVIHQGSDLAIARGVYTLHKVKCIHS